MKTETREARAKRLVCEILNITPDEFDMLSFELSCQYLEQYIKLRFGYDEDNMRAVYYIYVKSSDFQNWWTGRFASSCELFINIGYGTKTILECFTRLTYGIADEVVCKIERENLTIKSHIS